MVAPRRTVLAAAVVAAVAVGGASRVIPVGVALWDKSVGDVAYAVMVVFLFALARPRTTPVVVGLVATGVCFAIEVFQLTGIPARQPRILQIVLGTRFGWHDLVCYAVGGVLGAVLLRRLRLFSAPSSCP